MDKQVAQCLCLDVPTVLNHRAAVRLLSSFILLAITDNDVDDEDDEHNNNCDNDYDFTFNDIAR